MTKSVCLMSQICLLLLLCIVLLLYRVFIMELHYDELCVYYSILCAVFVFQCATDISMLCSPYTPTSNRRRRWRDDRPRTAVLWCYRLHASKSMRQQQRTELCCGDFSMHIAANRAARPTTQWQHRLRRHPGCAFQTRLDVCKDCLCFEIIERRATKCFRKRTKKGQTESYYY